MTHFDLTVFSKMFLIVAFSWSVIELAVRWYIFAAFHSVEERGDY